MELIKNILKPINKDKQDEQDSRRIHGSILDIMSIPVNIVSAFLRTLVSRVEMRPDYFTN
jgi:hypothetical protein